jgi:outer membrane murein-binding lipoprotein Lpp
MQEGKQAKTWEAHKGGVLCVSYTHDGRLVSCGRDNQILLWNTDGGKARTLDFSGEVPLRATFDHDGVTVFATDFSGRLTAWHVSDGKKIGELDLNPLPLSAQLATLTKKIADLQTGGNKASPDTEAVEAEAAKAAEEMDKAAKSLEQAKTIQKAKEDQVVRLKLEAAKNPPSGDVTAALAAARAARAKSREAVTNCTEILQVKTRQAEGLHQKLQHLKSENPAETLAAAKAALPRLKLAQAQAGVFQARESLAAKKREHEKLLAIAAAKQEESAQLTRDLSTATDSAAKSKIKNALKTVNAEAKAAETAARKSGSQLASEQASLDKLTAEYQRAKTALLPNLQQSRL